MDPFHESASRRTCVVYTLHGEGVLGVQGVKGEVEDNDQEGILDEVSPYLDEVVDTWDGGQERLDASHEEVVGIHVPEGNQDKEGGDE